MNIEKTQLPPQNDFFKRSTARTIAPDKRQSNTNSIELNMGDSFDSDYIISSLLNESGSQSKIYLAKKWGKLYVIKIYSDGFSPSREMKNFLLNCDHPNIMTMIHSGQKDDNYFEIYDYYEQGTLEDEQKVTKKHIQSVIIPAINEGLHELHKNNIVHCDIKPSNLFYNDDKSAVLIGDCGISSYTNSEGSSFAPMRGTPEYAPRVSSFMWNASFSPAYDYASFGLVICRLLLGRSLFHGMNVEEIALAWERGIELPPQIDGRYKNIVKGLIQEREEERWGYKDVKRWLDGEFVKPLRRERRRRRKKESSFIFGSFDGEIIVNKNLQELDSSLVKYWEHSKKVLARNDLFSFVKEYDIEIAAKLGDLSRMRDKDAAVFILHSLLSKEEKDIYFKGKHYANLKEYIGSLQNTNDSSAIDFISSGLLVYYLRQKNYNKAIVDKLEMLIEENGTDNMDAILMICSILQGKTTVSLLGEEIHNFQDLIKLMLKCNNNKILEMISSGDFYAWLYTMGYREELEIMKKL